MRRRKLRIISCDDRGALYQRFSYSEKSKSPGCRSSLPRIDSKCLERFESLRKVLLPVGYPCSVSPSYIKFVFLNTGQVIFISVSKVLSTQAMLLAVGLGQSAALPMAAVTTWLLKDGLGHLGSLMVGTSINTRFDSDPKRYKFISMALGQWANLLGILSLSRPGLFLLLTSLSAALSRIGTLAFTSSRAKIYENFASSRNLGDLMRCSQAQSTLATIIGTGIGIMISPWVGTQVESIIAVFLPVSALTHILAYKAVSKIYLRSLNVQRLEIVLNDWLRDGIIPSYESVGERERFILIPRSVYVATNPPILTSFVTRELAEDLKNKGYSVVHDSAKPSVDLFIKEEASATVILRGYFTAFLISRGRLTDDVHSWDKFHAGLKESKWDLSVVYLDEPEYRIRVS